MAIELYTQGLMFMDGILLADCPEFSTDYDTKNQPVETQAKGFAGVTPGAGLTEVSISEVIPRAGMEVDFYQRAKERAVVKLTGWRGAKKMQLEGFIMTVGEKHGVNQNASCSLKLTCGEPTEA